MSLFSSSEGSNDHELVVGERITLNAEKRTNGSRTTRIRPPWQTRTGPGRRALHSAVSVDE